MIKRFPGLEKIKLPEPPHKKNHKRLTFKIPRSTEKSLHKSMIYQDYGLREKTKWVIESVENFLDDEKHPFRKQLIMECEGIRNKDAQSTILISNELWEKSWRESIDAAIFGANNAPPDYINPSPGLVVMAAIITRLTEEKAVEEVF